MTSRIAITGAALLVMAAAGCRRDNANGIEAVGTVEVNEFDVAPMSPARVLELRVDESSPVRVGDTLATLTQATLGADIEQRRARLRTAEATLRELQAGARASEIQRAEADLDARQSEAERTARDLERIAALAREEAVSQQQLDAARSAARGAASARDAARETLQLLRQGTRPERIAGARAEVETARAALQAGLAARNDLVLTSPVTGIVLGKHAEPGEVVPAGAPVVTVGEIARPWVRVYVSQLDLPRLRVGQEGTAALDGVPDRPIRARIVAINTKAEFTPRVALTEEERHDLLFGVKVELLGAGDLVRPGLPVTVRIPLAPTEVVGEGRSRDSTP